MHENEVNFQAMKPSEKLGYQLLAASLGKAYIAALKEQYKRQQVQEETELMGF